MGFFDKLAKGIQSAAASAMDNPSALGGKTSSQWESRWEPAGTLSGDFSAYSEYVGVYKATLNGRVVYIGRAIEWNNGGFRKRLHDYTRDSASARGHGSGQKMNKHANEIQISLIKTGTDAKAAQVASALETVLIKKYQPEWNVQHNS